MKFQKDGIINEADFIITAIPRLVRMKRSEKSAHKAKAH